MAYCRRTDPAPDLLPLDRYLCPPPPSAARVASAFYLSLPSVVTLVLSMGSAVAVESVKGACVAWSRLRSMQSLATSTVLVVSWCCRSMRSRSIRPPRPVVAVTVASAFAELAMLPPRCVSGALIVGSPSLFARGPQRRRSWRERSAVPPARRSSRSMLSGDARIGSMVEVCPALPALASSVMRPSPRMWNAPSVGLRPQSRPTA